MIVDTRMTRRKFLLVCGATTAALLSGCINDERTTSAVNSDTKATEAALETRSAPTATPMANPTEAATATPTTLPTAAATRVTTRCPHRRVNDPFPGHCRLYVDSNGNNLCDYSEVN